MGTKLLTTCCINKHQFDKIYYVNSPNKMHFDHKQIKFVEQHFKATIRRLSEPTPSTCCASTESPFNMQVQKQNQADFNCLTFSPALDCEITHVDSDNMNSPQRSYNDVFELESEKQNSTTSFNLNDDDDNLLNSIMSEEDLFDDLLEINEPFEEVELEEEEPMTIKR